MLKVNELLDRTGKTIGSIASISLGLMVISFSAVIIKENLKSILSLRKIKTHVICVKSSEDDSNKEATKTSTKKAGSKKVSSKSEQAKESISEDKSE